jgi:hypothetical protein
VVLLNAPRVRRHLLSDRKYMNALAKSLSLIKFLGRNNDPADPFHMDEHQLVCVRGQFKDGVTFMCLSTPHLLNNMARAENRGFEKTPHIDGSFNWCKKSFSLIGMNSMGITSYNPVSVSIVSCTKFSVEGSNKISIRGYVRWPVYFVQLSQFVQEPCVRLLQQSIRADQRDRLTVEAAASIRRCS